MESDDCHCSNSTELVLDKKKIFNKVDLSKRKSKIICTLGPSTNSADVLVKMIDSGMDVVRIVSSRSETHLTPFCHKKVFREACKRRPESDVGLMFTTKGPEIKIGKLKESEVVLKENDILEISTLKIEGDSKTICCDYQFLCETVKEGGSLIILDRDEREIRSEIVEVGRMSIKVRLSDSGVIKESNTIHLPFADLRLPTISQDDESMITKFVLREGVDMVALTETRCARDVEDLRDMLGPRGLHIKIIAKIDNVLGIQNYEKILEASDGVLIARGRLCYELPQEKLFQAQKILIEKAKIAGKPVITATQMLESMVYSNRPTLAEVSDVANAVLDGSDAVLLSNETAHGNFPVESLEMAARICVEAEQCIYYKNSFEYGRSIISLPEMSLPKPKNLLNVQDVICQIAVRTAEYLNACLIIVITETGYTARVLAKCRPKQTILALCMSASVIRQLKIARGVATLKIPSFLGSENLINQSIMYAKESGSIKAGDKIVCLLGENEETPDYVNVMKITTVV